MVVGVSNEPDHALVADTDINTGSGRDRQLLTVITIVPKAVFVLVLGVLVIRRRKPVL